jgi:hypothetical protein
MKTLTQSSTTTSYSYNTLNELTVSQLTQGSTTLSTVNYAYDADGDLTSDVAHAYSYDAENRLVGIDYGLPNDSTTFAYDGLGRRVAITEISGTYLLIVAAPTMQAASSCDPVAPEQPIAPISFPSSISGMPPREAIMSSSVI